MLAHLGHNIAWKVGILFGELMKWDGLHTLSKNRKQTQGYKFVVYLLLQNFYAPLLYILPYCSILWVCRLKNLLK